MPTTKTRLVRNPARLDPTRTTTIRRQFVSKMDAKFKRLRCEVARFVARDDELGLAGRKHVVLQRTYAFATDAAKVDAFNAWLQRQVDEGILSVDDTGQAWTNPYVDSAYKKGLENSYVSLHKEALAESPEFYAGSREQFLRSAFWAPETTDKLRLMYTRTFEELKGVTATMAKDMRAILTDALARGDSPLKTARALNEQIGKLGRTRARAIARTETIRAHAEGQLDAFEKLGVDKVGVMAEWSTANDGLVCEECFAMEGEAFPVKESHGMLPLHPNCRCAWVPFTEEALASETREYRLPPGLPSTPAVKALLQREKALAVKVRDLRKAYRSGQRELRKELLRLKGELQSVRDEIAKIAGKAPVAPPVAVPKATTTTKKAAAKAKARAKSMGTKYNTAEEYRQAIIQAKEGTRTAAQEAEIERLLGELKRLEKEIAELRSKMLATTDATEAGVAARRRLLREQWPLQEQAARKRHAVNKLKKSTGANTAQLRKTLAEADNLAGMFDEWVDMDKGFKGVANDILGWIPKNSVSTREAGQLEWLGTFKHAGNRRGGLLGQYNPRSHVIDVYGRYNETFAHEFGHHVEYNLKGLRLAQKRFFDSRTASEKITRLFGDVYGKKDKWGRLSVYAGRVYGSSPGEVISVGIEQLWKNPYKVARKDPEWFNFLVSHLKGLVE